MAEIVLVADELDALIGQSVSAAVAQRFQEPMLDTYARQREHIRQISRFKPSDFE